MSTKTNYGRWVASNCSAMFRSSGTTNNHRSDVFEDILERIGHGGSVLYDEDA